MLGEGERSRGLIKEAGHFSVPNPSTDCRLPLTQTKKNIDGFSSKLPVGSTTGFHRQGVKDIPFLSFPRGGGGKAGRSFSR